VDLKQNWFQDPLVQMIVSLEGMGGGQLSGN
jgi:hypothetical protein